MSDKISVYLKDKSITPSSYYRVYQYTNQLDLNFRYNELLPKFLIKWKSTNNVFINFIRKIVIFIFSYMRTVFFLIRDIINKPDKIIVSKRIFPRFDSILINLLIRISSKKSKLIWDFDDNILDGKEIGRKQFEILERISEIIIVNNALLKKTINKNYHCKVEIKYTTDGDINYINVNEIINHRKKSYSGNINVVWLGTKSNLPNLHTILDYFDIAGEKIDKLLTLYVISDFIVDYNSTNFKIINIPWTRQGAVKTLKDMHFGIMPLIDNKYNRGKGSFKLIQYMAAALPVIGDNTGNNKNVINDNVGFLIDDEKKEWVDSLIKLSSDLNLWEIKSFESIKKFNKEFSFEENLNFWKNVVKKKGDQL